MPFSRRDFLRYGATATAALAIPAPLLADTSRAAASVFPPDPDRARLAAWTHVVRQAGLATPDTPFGEAVVRVGAEAIGTPYEAFTLEQYLRAGGDPVRTEPLTLSLTRFDCVSLVESCIAVARVAAQGNAASWDEFGREMERLRYRGGERRGYVSRLHYFSEWMRDNARRGGVRELTEELGGVHDPRPLRFMTEHRDAYPALAHPAVFRAIAEREQALDDEPRFFLPTARIPDAADRIQTGDVLAFATSIAGLDVTHSALAYRDAQGTLRVLHAPLSGGAVEISRKTLPEYVVAIRKSTGILVARPLRLPSQNG